MVSSDEEYAPGASDDEVDAHRVSQRGGGASHSRIRGLAKDHAFKEVKRTWEDVEEGEDGTITGTINSLLQKGKRKR